MTFRPSDDVLDKISKDSLVNQNNDGNQGEWKNIFNNSENFVNDGNIGNEGTNSIIVDEKIEEVKAPDLSELLKDTGANKISDDTFSNNNLESILKEEPVNEVVNLQTIPSVNLGNQQVQNQQSQNQEGQNQQDNISDLEKKNEVGNGQVSDVNMAQEQEKLGDYKDSNKMLDVDRSAIVSGMEGSINSNIDFLVDNEWFGIVNKYKKINRLFFRWGAFIIITIIGILSGIFIQISANWTNRIQMVDESSIENKGKWIEDTPDKILLPLIENGVQIDVSIPYGSVSLEGTNISSKSNLIVYNGIVFPQLLSFDYSLGDTISLEDFTSIDLTSVDIKNLVDFLIKNNSIYKNTTNLPNAADLRWGANRFQGSLIDGFNLRCVDSNKVSSFVCDKFLETFYVYGKYYDLNYYSSEVLELIKDLKKHNKAIEPICNMVKEYTLHVGSVSDVDILLLVMGYCGEDDIIYYKKLVNFIDLENSLGQPVLSSKVYDDPDLNAYKLLSAQQNVYRFLDGVSLNEGYIKNYLEFVKTLINKDKGTNRYLHPIYKDLLYVFNMYELYPKLLEKGKLSSDFNLQIDQINNGNTQGSPSLLSQLTISDIIQSDSDFTGLVEEKTVEELFSQYYAMNDRLKIRKADFISDDMVRVQTEVSTDEILSVTEGVTLKVTVVLKKWDNYLYVDSIKIANQPKFTDVLNAYLSGENVTFYAILNYIDEQVGMWYEIYNPDEQQQTTLCDELMGMQDIVVYSCDESSISLYKGDVEYDFEMVDGILDSFTISDETLDQVIKDELSGILFIREYTSSIIKTIIDFTIETEDVGIEKKLDIIDQFRIHFKVLPDNISEIEGNSDLFLIDFTLGEFVLQGYYDVNTYILNKIAYKNCKKPLEIKDLSLEITAENESQLIEILNNPRVFFANANPLIYSKYKKACLGQ